MEMVEERYLNKLVRSMRMASPLMIIWKGNWLGKPEV